MDSLKFCRFWGVLKSYTKNYRIWGYWEVRCFTFSCKLTKLCAWELSKTLYWSVFHKKALHVVVVSNLYMGICSYRDVTITTYFFNSFILFWRTVSGVTLPSWMSRYWVYFILFCVIESFDPQIFTCLGIHVYCPTVSDLSKKVRKRYFSEDTDIL